MRALVLLFASALALATAQAGEMAKQGNESSTIYFVSTGGTVWVGIKRTDNGDAMFDKMGVRCTETGPHSRHGDCAMSDNSGDQVFTTYEPGVFHYVRGTGKYAGISGEGEWRCEHLRSLDDGTELTLCPQRSSWKLP